MSTERTFTATTAGRIWADVLSPLGAVNVTVDPSITHAEITVRTNSDEGAIAEAVRNTTVREHVTDGLSVFEVRVPELPGDGTVMQIGRSTFNLSRGSNTDEMSGAVIRGGDFWVGGQQVVSDGRVVVQQGTIVGGTCGAVLLVDVKVPDHSSVRLETTDADLLVLHGDLQVLDVRSLSGGVEAKGVHTLRINTTSGDVAAERVESRVDVYSVSGDLEIGAYNGSEFRFNSVSGDLEVSATPAATGSITANTVSGDVTTRGADHLQHRVATVTGKTRRR